MPISNPPIIAMTVGKANSLGKLERLKSRKQIDVLFSSGKKITVFPFRLIYLCHAGSGLVKAGFTVSSKNFPQAVDRNRIKRLSREAYRVENSPLKDAVRVNKLQLNLFFIYTGREILSFQEVNIPLKKVLEKLVRNIHEDHSANT